VVGLAGDSNSRIASGRRGGPCLAPPVGPSAAALVDALTEPTSVILSVLQSGSLRDYAGRPTIRFGWIALDWLDRSIQWLDEHGTHPYWLVEEFERDEFRARFARTCDRIASHRIVIQEASVSMRTLFFRPFAVFAGVCVSAALSMPASALQAQTRSSTPADAPGKPATGLAGTWQSANTLVEITTDGTLLVGEVLYRYTVQGDTLTLIGVDGSVPVPFQLNGDRLTVSLNGQITVMQRVVPGQTAPGSAGGTAPAELAGKWCYFSNVNATSGGGSMSDECFTMGANGTYSYHRESSMSGTYGSTASAQNDGGTWELNGDRLTVNSRSAGTSVYTLVKKNHPKNHDPMLCLDGRCFVTYGPKPPWR